MGELAVALERGWDGGSNNARAIFLLRSFEFSTVDRALVLSNDELSIEDWQALERLAAHGYLTARHRAEDDLFGTYGTVFTATRCGVEAHQRLLQLWREHDMAGPSSLIATRRIYRRILLEGMYHDRKPLRVEIWDDQQPGRRVELPDRSWLQLAGWRLEPDDVEPELVHLRGERLVDIETTHAVPHRAGTSGLKIIEYRLTKEGTDYVEQLEGADMSATPKQQEDDEGWYQTADSKSGRVPSLKVTNNYHGSVSNVHTGIGDLNVGIDPAELERFVAQIHAFVPSLVFPNASEQAELATTVEALSVERNPTRAATLTERIRGLVTRASGPLKDIAVGVIDAELKRLTGSQ